MSPERLGVYILGALGDVATTVVLGAAAVARGLVEPVGLVTELPEIADGAGLAPLGSLVFGGCDVRDGDLARSAEGLAREAQIFPLELVERCRDALEAASARVRLVAAPPEAVEATQRALHEFRDRERLERVVVVNLASTEPLPGEAFVLGLLGGSPRDLERAVRGGGRAGLPASVCYAYAAIDAGFPYVNFTPSVGASCAALRALAEERGVPHMGRDGKTGETLLKAALAPMFVGRNLRVLSWTGYNILGNRDGATLEDEARKRAKLATKGAVLKSILGPSSGGGLEVRGRFVYVPSLSDWKTAWDFIHFQGFLGTKMHLELTWRGADSILAAPLVLDLVRLIERAARAGRRGLVPELACFFKAPEGVDEHAFPAQLEMLKRFAAEMRGDSRA